MKFVSFRGYAPDPTWGAYDAPPDPLVDWGGRPYPSPSLLAPSAPRLPRSTEGTHVISYKDSVPPLLLF